MISFPTNPVLNQVYTFGSKSWYWAGNRWVVTPLAGGTHVSVSNNIVNVDFTDYATVASVSLQLIGIRVGLVTSSDLGVILGNYPTNTYISSNYASIAYVEDQIANVAIGNINLSGFATAEFVTNSIANINLSGFATADFVSNAIASINIENYATNAYTSAYIQSIIALNMAPLVQAATIDVGSFTSNSTIALDMGTLDAPSGILYDLGKI